MCSVISLTRHYFWESISSCSLKLQWEGRPHFSGSRKNAYIKAFIHLTCQLRAYCVSHRVVQGWQVTRTKPVCVHDQIHLYEQYSKQVHAKKLNSSQLVPHWRLLAKSLAKYWRTIALNSELYCQTLWRNFQTSRGFYAGLCISSISSTYIHLAPWYQRNSIVLCHRELCSNSSLIPLTTGSDPRAHWRPGPSSRLGPCAWQAGHLLTSDGLSHSHLWVNAVSPS